MIGRPDPKASSAALEALKDTPQWLTWKAWLDHAVPLDADRCAWCCEVNGPRDGCETGRRLWDDYRLARIESTAVPQNK